LKGYDQEQARLMDERCIVVDENDRAIGALDKKTCLCMDYDCDDRTHLEFPLPPPCAPRPSHGKHQQGSPTPRILSICLPTIGWKVTLAKACCRKDYFRWHVDKYMLLPSAGRFRAGEGRGKSTRCAVPILL